jgi:hypothetical protein
MEEEAVLKANVVVGVEEEVEVEDADEEGEVGVILPPMPVAGSLLISGIQCLKRNAKPYGMNEVILRNAN